MDYGYRRAKELWEVSDGAVFLLAELSEVIPEEIGSFMPMVADLAMCNSFPQANSLHTTIWKELPTIMRAMGKKAWFPYLQTTLRAFLEPM